MTAAEAGTPVAADGVDLVDEDDARRIALRLLEHVADARRADADEHLDEVRAGNREERHVRLAGDGAGEQGLAGAGRADEQAALRDAAAEPLELLRVLEEFDDFLELLLRLVDTGDVGEGDAPLVLLQHAGARLAETEDAARAALHPPHEVDPDADQEQHRERRDEQRHQKAGLLRRRRLDADALGDERGDDVGTLRREGAEAMAILHGADDFLAANRHRLDLAGFDVGEEVRIGQLRVRNPPSGFLHLAEQPYQDQADDDPQDRVTLKLHEPRLPWAVPPRPASTATRSRSGGQRPRFFHRRLAR